MNEYYLYLKAFHIVAMVAWMAGMLYLPRLYVYHSSVKVGGEASEQFKVMERRLLKAIVNPGMLATFILGGLLVWHDGGESWAGVREWLRGAGWFHAKVALVVGMVILHIFLARWRKAFQRDARPHSAKFFRIVNEVPTVLMIVIILLAVVKPF